MKTYFVQLGKASENLQGTMSLQEWGKLWKASISLCDTIKDVNKMYKQTSPAKGLGGQHFRILHQVEKSLSIFFSQSYQWRRKREGRGFWQPLPFSKEAAYPFPKI